MSSFACFSSSRRADNVYRIVIWIYLSTSSSFVFFKFSRYLNAYLLYCHGYLSTWHWQNWIFHQRPLNKTDWSTLRALLICLLLDLIPLGSVGPSIYESWTRLRNLYLFYTNCVFYFMAGDFSFSHFLLARLFLKKKTCYRQMRPLSICLMLRA